MIRLAARYLSVFTVAFGLSVAHAQYDSGILTITPYRDVMNICTSSPPYLGLAGAIKKLTTEGY